jgi:uncharacterized membrane protein YraQ (UPF0718 family)
MKKRVAILVALMVLIAGYFWSSSRYPSLNEKAAMAGTAMGDALSFDARYGVNPNDPAWKRILRSTANWAYTNKEGMTFGVLLGTVMLTLLRILPGRPSRSTFLNALKGFLIGAPLGVCVNCAAPIAKSMYHGGSPLETSLATMFSSPTLNIVVLSMTFSLFPLYMAVSKVAVALGLILVIVPLLARFAFHAVRHPATAAVEEPAPPEPVAVSEGWGAALVGTARGLLSSFWYMLVTTVPLMLVAGFLGVVLATLLPLEALVGWEPTLPRLLLVALVGTFLPVPMAFDVVAVQGLMIAGLRPELAMVLLVTLGSYSIYPFFIVANAASRRVAVALFAVVALLGVGAGYFAHGYERHRTATAMALFKAHFAGRVPSGVASAGEAAATLGRADATPVPVAGPREAVHAEGDIRVESVAYRPRGPVAGLPFTRREGHELGLDYGDVMYLDFMVPFSQGRGIASGDFDNDGWTDLAVATNRGVLLYRNLGTGRFAPVPLGAAGLGALNVMLVAFVDVDRDGWLDLYLGAFGDADYFVLNDRNGFRQPHVLKVPHQGALFIQAASFFDLDRDGYLDFVKGNWFFQIPGAFPSARATNYLARNRGGRAFDQVALDEIPGDTLSTLISDINGDGHPDMIIGNDFMEPDIYYLGKPGGQFRQLVAGDVVPISALATMSLDSADFNNDLILDLYVAGKTEDFSTRRNAARSEQQDIRSFRSMILSQRAEFDRTYCSEIRHPADQKRCAAFLTKRTQVRERSTAACESVSEPAAKDECMVTMYMLMARIKDDRALCASIPDRFPAHRTFCDDYFAYLAVSQKKPPPVYKYLDRGAIDQAMQGNILLQGSREGTFTDVAKAMGVYDGAWTWNAKFADLDNDEWQDLYLATGWWLEDRRYSNRFFHNSGGRKFTAREKEFGLTNQLKVGAYTYIDIDNDGDLDIVSTAMHGFITVFINNESKNNLITFEFRDQKGNAFGIGNKVYVHYGPGGERHQVREIKASSGFLSFDAPYAHFGLGPHRQVERVEIVWSTGERTVIDKPLEANRKYVIHRDCRASCRQPGSAPGG